MASLSCVSKRAPSARVSSRQQPSFAPFRATVIRRSAAVVCSQQRDVDGADAAIPVTKRDLLAVATSAVALSVAQRCVGARLQAYPGASYAAYLMRQYCIVLLLQVLHHRCSAIRHWRCRNAHKPGTSFDAPLLSHFCTILPSPQRCCR